MADVFISYSRKDKAFVQRLEEALKQRERKAWVDWEGIRPTEEFMQAIYRAIEGADTFIFVLSPDSVSSVVCGKEIAHAVAQNKRMVPLVARDVNAAEVPEALAKLNWIFCRESDPFDAATETLITALAPTLERRGLALLVRSALVSHCSAARRLSSRRTKLVFLPFASHFTASMSRVVCARTQSVVAFQRISPGCDGGPKGSSRRSPATITLSSGIFGGAENRVADVAADGARAMQESDRASPGRMRDQT